MRILVLCYEYPPLGGGGGRAAHSIAAQLVARGHTARVQTAALGWHSTRDITDGVEIFRTGSGRRVAESCAVHEMGLYCLTSFLPTLRHIREWKPDVIHAHFAVPTGILAWAVHRMTGVPYVITAQLGDVPGGVPEQTDTLFKLVGPIARQVWKMAAAVTAVSIFVQELAVRAYQRPVTRIPNGIDLSNMVPQIGAVRPTRHLVFVGRFNAQKNLPWLIGALARLTNGNWRATIVGDGPERETVERLIDEHRLRDRITLAGWLSNSEVSAVLQDADIFCLPSSSEGLSVAALEALKHGLAMVTSDIPGSIDVVEHGKNGYRLPLDESYIDKLNWLLESEETLRSMKQASHEKAREFDIATIAAQYESVLHAASQGL